MKRQALAFLALCMLSLPAFAFEPAGPQPAATFFYVSIPLDATSTRERTPSFGFSLRGEKEYQVLNIDNRMMSRFLEAAAIGGVGAQWLIVGGVAAAAAIAVGSKGGSVDQQRQQQEQAQQQAAAQQAAVQQQAAQQAAQKQADAAKAPCPKAC